jgi:hypothetical protein
MYLSASRVPDRHSSVNASYINMLEKERAMQAGLIPTTQRDRGSTAAARRLADQGHRAAQLALTVQPMLHHPTATSAAAF